MNKIILSGDTVQIELIDGEENTNGTWIVERDEEDSNNTFGGDTGVDADFGMEEELIETKLFKKYG